MIPKIIHYCWFGYAKFDSLSKACLASWQKYLPDYDINILGNEELDENENAFVGFAIKNQLWAFVADYYRIKVLFEEGGIYMDTDMMLLRSLDPLLHNSGFLGAESSTLVNAAIMGFKPKHPFLDALLYCYNTLRPESILEIKQMTIPHILTHLIKDTYSYRGAFDELVNLPNLQIFPPAYFYSMPFSKQVISSEYPFYIHEESYAVHLWNASWVDHSIVFYLRNQKYRKALKKFNEDWNNNNVDYNYLKKVIYALLFHD